VLGVARASSAQQRKIWRIGFFYFGSKQSAQETGRYAVFLQGMCELGYTEGKNFVLEARFADGKAERLPELAAELVRAKVDLIVSSGTPADLAARRATAAIPIVMTLSVDPVADGVAANLACPGGNVTGLTLVMTHRLPTIALSSEHAEAGSLMSYGPDLRDNFRRAATYVDKIFRGARPGELPIEQPAKFDLVINLKAARTLGLSVPYEMRFRADRVIE
jgi:ABC-type uncharacterized transport system substrate-binding protein